MEEEAARFVSRREIYYWKCDRSAAFHGTHDRGMPATEIETDLHRALSRHFDAQSVKLSAGAGQGNHLTWNAKVDGVSMFVRVENGPEQDRHLAVESTMLDRVRAIGVPTPKVLGCDASRVDVPFAWQALERIDAPDLNHWQKQGKLDVARIAFDIGAAVAKWQSIELPGFGVPDEKLRGHHRTYPAYFHLQLDRHLAFLVDGGFLTARQSAEILSAISEHESLLDLKRGCFVHKDLALWNVLGPPERIVAFIDFDDAISGDPMDDFSLLGCFHDTAFLAHAFAGYESERSLPDEARRRFWLHLLRNMIVKAVIRVGAGYFERSDQFFLIGKGGTGADLKNLTRQRLTTALNGLRGDLEIDLK